MATTSLNTTAEEQKKVDVLTAAANNAAATTSGTASTGASAATPSTVATDSTGTGTTSTGAASSNGVTNEQRMDYINQMYDAQAKARQQELEAAYQQNLSDRQAALEQIAPSYQEKANDLGVQYERNRQNFWNQAAASGINTGVSAQESLARNSEYQRDYGNLRTSQAEAEAEAQRGINDLTTQYKSDISSALADNDYARAAALLDEYNNAYNRDVEKASLLAQYGDFSAYSDLYGSDTADAMLALWRAQNPDLAYQTGSITQAQWENLKNGKPMNDGLDESGNRIVTAAASATNANDWHKNAGWDPLNQTAVSQAIQKTIAEAHARGDTIALY